MSRTQKDSVYKIFKSHGSRIQKNTARDGDVWYWGSVVTPHGYVHVYAEPEFATFSCMHDGYEISRTIRKNFTPRGLVTVARRFIEEMQ